jgi:hypothetical protein
MRWDFLSYRLPREPSAPRLALWRATGRLGAIQVSDGLVAIPHSERNVEHLEWLASGIHEHGGSAAVWIAQPTSERVHAGYVAELRAALDDEYRTVVREAEATCGSEADRRKTLRRLRAQLRRIGSRDYVGAPIGHLARQAVDRLAQMTQEVGPR